MVMLAAALVLLEFTAPSGKALYETNCASCHGARLEGGPRVPSLRHTPASYVDFMLRTGRMPTTVLGEQSLAKPPRLNEAQIATLRAYIAGETDGERGLPSVRIGDVRRGRALFARNCEQCHGAAGHGASVGYDIIAPPLDRATPLDVAEAVRNGPGEMPTFGPDVLSDAEVADLNAYVRFLREDTKTYNPGGFAAADIGPVAEGFFAWFFGLGALTWFLRKLCAGA